MISEPAAANASAMPRPMPRLAPVTNAVLPFRLNRSITFRRLCSSPKKASMPDGAHQGLHVVVIAVRQYVVGAIQVDEGRTSFSQTFRVWIGSYIVFGNQTVQNSIRQFGVFPRFLAATETLCQDVQPGSRTGTG